VDLISTIIISTRRSVRFPPIMDRLPAELVLQIVETFGFRDLLFFSAAFQRYRPLMAPAASRFIRDIMMEGTPKVKKVIKISRSLPLEFIHWWTSEMGYSLKGPSEWAEFSDDLISVSAEFARSPVNLIIQFISSHP
jgi:hypothetical protein